MQLKLPLDFIPQYFLYNLKIGFMFILMDYTKFYRFISIYFKFENLWPSFIL